MPGVAFRSGKAALGVHDADVEEFRHLDPLDQRAVRATAFERTLERPAHCIIEVVERDRGRHRKPHALDRAGLQRDDRLVGEHGIEHGAAG